MKETLAEIVRPEPGPYIYEAVLERVVDGDTLIVRIDLGFDVWKSQRVRLRGVDAPSLDTPQGEKAKRFVEQKMAKAEKVVIRTYKLDKFGRYVADLFYGKADAKANELVKEGGFLSLDLLGRGLAVRMY